MSNMAYCRMQNTRTDFMDAAEHLLDDTLSDEEHMARMAIARRILELAQELEYWTGEDGELEIPNRPYGEEGLDCPACGCEDYTSEDGCPSCGEHNDSY